MCKSMLVCLEKQACFMMALLGKQLKQISLLFMVIYLFGPVGTLPIYGATLSVVMSGTGQGSVSSSPSGITCPGTCTASFTTAILYPGPALNSYFSGWGGACAGMENCSLALDIDKTVNAFFEQRSSLIRVDGSNYGALQAAYNKIAPGGKVMVVALDQAGSLDLAKGVDFTIEGGYDGAFSANAGNITKLHGAVAIRSGSLKANRLVLAPPVASTPPPAPSGVFATGGDGQVTIGWDAVPGANSYNVYYATASGVTRSNGTKVTGANSGQTVAGLGNGVTHYFVVTALNANGESLESAQVIITPVHVALPAPTGVTAAPGNGQATIGWNTVAGATSYNIYWSTSSGVTKENGTKIQAVAESPYKHTGLANGTTYYYIVTAGNGVEESAPSAEAAAKPTATVVLRLIKMSLFGTADQLMGYTTYEYDAAGRIEKSAVYGATGVLSNYATYEYNEAGSVTKVSNYILGDLLTGYVTTEYNGEGWPIKISTYISSGETSSMTGYVTNEYDTVGNVIKTSTCGPTGIVSAYTVYEYNATGGMTKETTYMAGEYNSYTTYEYNEAGKITKESEYDINGDLAEYTTTEYDDAGRMVRVTIYNGFTGLAKKATTYEYNEANRLAKTSSFDVAGNLTAYSTIEYNSDGKKAKISVYDDTGVLKQYTTFEYGP